MSRILSILGGLMVVAGVFVPFASSAGISVSMWTSGGLSDTKGPVYVILGLGIVITLVGLLNKRWVNIVNILLGLGAAGLGALLFVGEKEKQLEPGIGTWLIILGGVVALVGAIMGVAKKPVKA